MKGWKTLPLGDALTFQRGFDITKDAQRDGPYFVVSSSGPKSTHAEFKVDGPGVIIGRKGSLGTVYYSEKKFWPHDTTLWIKDFHGNDPRFAYYFLQTMGFERLDAGASNPTLNRNHIHTIPVLWPPAAVQRRIASILSAYDDLIENSQRRIKTLESMARALYREWFVHFRFPGHENHPRVASPLGEIPEGWEVRRLEGLCLSIQDGDWIETKDQGGQDFRLLQISNVGVGEFVETGNFRYVTEQTFKRLRCTELSPGDLLVARMPDPIGRAWLVTKMPWRMITAVDVAIIRADPMAIQPSFLAQAWNEGANLQRVAAQASGTTRLRITRRQLAAMDFIVPPVPMQQRFTEITQPQHSAIEALRRKVQTLRRTRDLLLPRLLSGQIALGELEVA